MTNSVPLDAAAPGVSLRTPVTPRGLRSTLTFERRYRARLACVWVLWTNARGLESWWGPRGFVTHVEQLDPRPGGEWRSSLTATAPAMIDLVHQLGLPLTTRVCATYTEVLRQRRIRYTNRVDFIPDVEPYEVAVTLELHVAAEELLMVVTHDAMHNETWTRLWQQLWVSRLARLARRIV